MDVIHRIAAEGTGAEADDDLEGEVDAFNTEGLALDGGGDLPQSGISGAAADSFAAQQTIAKLSEAVVTDETAKTYKRCVNLMDSYRHLWFKMSLFPIIHEILMHSLDIGDRSKIPV
jgi:hypothetical protein